MKKVTLLLLLLPFLITAQIHVDNTWKNTINPIFQNLDKSKVQSGILLDYAMEFTDVNAYNGVITDTTYIDANVLGNIYKTLFMGKVVADTIHTPMFDRYAYNWARERYKATKDSSGVYILSGLLYNYQTLNENALAQNKITVSNSKYYDKYIGGVWQNPYETRRTFALTPPVLHSRSKDVSFKLPSSLFLSNLKNQIASIQINAGNGQGYQNLPFDTALSLHFYENKIHDLTFKVTLTNGQILYCRSKFKIDDPKFKTPQARGAIVINDSRVYIQDDNNFFNAAWLTIRRIPGNSQITKPLIIAEGLDTGNFTAPEDFGGETTLEDFDKSLFNSGNLKNLIEIGTNDYDLIYIDWVRGMADMRDNSRVLEEVIKWVNAQKLLSGSTHPNVLLGQSMGGVIGRYTLARMEKENKTHNVRLFIAHDSPMQGANVPLAFQHFATHMKEEYANAPAAWAIGETLIPIGFGLAELGSNFLNYFGANTSVPAFVTPAQLLSLQDQTASRQLNYWSLNAGHSQTRSYNQAWQQTLTLMGWPSQSENIAISNGSECAGNHGFSPGAPLLVIDSRSNPGFALDMLNAVLAPVVGVAIQDIGLIIVGAIPGRSRWQTNFDFNSYGVQGSQNMIYRGRLRFEKKILWIGPTIKHDLFNKSFNAPADALPFDTYSGGRFNFLENDGDFALDIPILADLVDVVNEYYGFIPVISSLDIKRNNQQVTHTDYSKKFAGGTTPEPALVSGFDRFIVDYNSNGMNNEHISFQARNGNWLAAELNAQPIVPTDCSYICATNAISGFDRVCGQSAIYQAPMGATTYQWQLNGNSAVIQSGANTSSVIIRKNSLFNGWITLSVTLSSQTCGASTLSKRIYIGVPTLESIEQVTPLSTGLQDPISPILDCDKIAIKLNFAPSNLEVLEVQWEKVSTDFYWSHENDQYAIIAPVCNQPIVFKARYRSSCGWSAWENITYNTGCLKTCTTQPGGNITSTNFIIFPVPADTTLSVKFKNLPTGLLQNGQTLNIRLINMNATTVRNINAVGTQTNIDVSNLPPGIYTLVLNHNGGLESHQIAIQ